jgi:hypothetical protein
MPSGTPRVAGRAQRPSTDPFRDAAKDEERIGAEIWDHARASDEDIPGSEDH